jgi:hypothetical protein
MTESQRNCDTVSTRGRTKEGLNSLNILNVVFTGGSAEEAFRREPVCFLCCYGDQNFTTHSMLVNRPGRGTG